MCLQFRHFSVNHQDFLFSVKESREEYYQTAYLLTKQLFVGIAKNSKIFCSEKYGFNDYPFTYSERQLDSILLPELFRLCKGYVFAEYPVTRNSKEYHSDNSKGRVDYWCIYNGYSFVIELKHSYHNIVSNQTKKETVSRWRTMNKYQLSSIKKDLRNFTEHTDGVIRLALQFITVECGKDSSEELVDTYKLKEQSVLEVLYKDLKRISVPDYLSSWEIDKKMVLAFSNDGMSYPGLILAAKFYEPIYHLGSKKKIINRYGQRI